METNTNGVLMGLGVTNDWDHVLRRTNVYVQGLAGMVHHTYRYDAASRLTNLAAGVLKADYSYLANSWLVGQVTQRQATLVRMTTSRTYDNLNRLVALTHTPGVGAVPWVSAYEYNAAGQRTRHGDARGQWKYGYDELGQVVSGRRYWADGTAVAGQQFEYGFDDIGNRTEARAGGDNFGVHLRESEYEANSLNQYVSRTVPGAVDVVGVARANAGVTVNDQPASDRYREYFRHELTLDNASGPVYAGVTNRAVYDGETNTVSGSVLLPPATEIHP